MGKQLKLVQFPDVMHSVQAEPSPITKVDVACAFRLLVLSKPCHSASDVSVFTWLQFTPFLFTQYTHMIMPMSGEMLSPPGTGSGCQQVTYLCFCKLG
jgi:hypothetical protein